MLQTLKIFFCSFPDVDVRRMAVNWLRSLGSDELVDYLPQLVQALKHETWEPSPLAYFLLERALTSPRVAHHLYWLLAQALPGECPQVQSVVYAFLYTVQGRIKKYSQETFNSFNRSNCEQFYISFCYIVPSQHNAFVISIN
jgi:phosphatidylinositol-4-phosphate 3-kinase